LAASPGREPHLPHAFCSLDILRRYLSDTAKDPPQAGAFAFGMTVTACLVAVIVLLHYGKLKNDLSVLQNAQGMRRNKVSMICGVFAAPNLALLACYDTARTPALHLLFVLGFFPASVVYLFAITSLYKLLVADMERKRVDDSAAVTKTRWVSLRTSLR
jgi:choline-glycine betaine transporter